MDLETKLKAYCNCEILRCQARATAIASEFWHTNSAFDLARSHEAAAEAATVKRVLTEVLEILEYCKYN